MTEPTPTVAEMVEYLYRRAMAKDELKRAVAEYQRLLAHHNMAPSSTPMPVPGPNPNHPFPKGR